MLIQAAKTSPSNSFLWNDILSVKEAFFRMLIVILVIVSKSGFGKMHGLTIFPFFFFQSYTTLRGLSSRVYTQSRFDAGNWHWHIIMRTAATNEEKGCKEKLLQLLDTRSVTPTVTDIPIWKLTIYMVFFAVKSLYKFLNSKGVLSDLSPTI